MLNNSVAAHILRYILIFFFCLTGCTQQINSIKVLDKFQSHPTAQYWIVLENSPATLKKLIEKDCIIYNDLKDDMIIVLVDDKTYNMLHTSDNIYLEQLP